MELTVRIAKDAGGLYHAWCPSLPGCAVLGGTQTEARSKIARAVHGYLARLDVVLPRELARCGAPCGAPGRMR